MKKNKIFAAALTLSLLYAHNYALAWEVNIKENPFAPEKFIGVSKADRYLYVIENEDDLKVNKIYPSIHGRVEGEKYVEGDLKTPEGVYFVTTKIRSKLDFEKYGSGAYVLNYPNPIDKIKQKTGHGIWIHSKGLPIEGQRTEGCVAVDLDDFAELSEFLPSGTPVVLAENLLEPSDTLANHTQKQTTDSQTIALSETNEISASQSIDYGVEMHPEELQSNISMTTDAEGEVPTYLQLAQDVEVNNEDQNKALVSEENSAYNETQAKNLPTQELEPQANAAQSSPILEVAAQAIETQTIDAQAPAGISEDRIVQVAALGNLADKNILKKSKSEAEVILEKTKAWNNAWENRSSEFFNFYDSTKYGLAQSESYLKFAEQKNYFFNILPWINIIYGEIYALEGTDYWVTWFEQEYRAPNITSTGIRRLYWQKDKKNEYKIVAMEWLPRKLNLYDTYFATIKKEVGEFVGQWQKDWLAGDLDKYRSYYSQNAVQGKLKGEEIFDHKQNIWARKQPTKLEFTEMEFDESGNTIIVRMKQRYADSKGYSDLGRKEIVLTKVNDTWLIIKETWKRI